MNSELINKIISKMEKELHPDQLTKLESVLTEIQNEKNSYNNVTKKNNLVKQFISTKRIEGCSNRTEKYYLSTLLFFENNIGQDICTVNTSQIREYLINYQKINNCSNVTLDNIRRILSSFYKWLEEEDYILKSPMRRIHRIKALLVPGDFDHSVTGEKSQKVTRENDQKSHLTPLIIRFPENCQKQFLPFL